MSGYGPPRLFGCAPATAQKATASMFGHVYRVLSRLDRQVGGECQGRCRVRRVYADCLAEVEGVASLGEVEGPLSRTCSGCRPVASVATGPALGVPGPGGLVGGSGWASDQAACLCAA